ncbi:integrase core domain-containing protein [Zoogloea sp.]|uniref:integrase core domain-containing protein n=1 Tax=Zoogloea sp. TaxID=49181 RepID=UPI0035B3DFB2
MRTDNGPVFTSRVIGDWIQRYNHQQPHQALEMNAPAEAFALAARSAQDLLGQYARPICRSSIFI